MPARLPVLRHLPIGRKLLILLGVPFVVALVVIGSSLYASQVTMRANRLERERDRYHFAIQDLDTAVAKFMGEVDNEGLDELRIGHAIASLQEARDETLLLSVSLSTSQGRAQEALAADVLTLIARGRAIAASGNQQALHSLWDFARLRVEDPIQRQLARASAASQASTEAAERKSTIVTAVVLGLGAVALLFGLLLSVSFGRHFLQSLSALSAGAQRISSGDLVTAIEQNSRDELGQLTGAFNTMAKSLAQSQALLLQSERLAAVGSLAAGVGHEINNPLAFIMSNLEYIQEGLTSLREPDSAPDADLLAAVDDVLVGTGRVRDIVKNLKAFSRGDDAQRGPVKVEQVLDSTLNMVANQIRHKAALRKEYGGIGAVIGNEGRLAQVFMNLLVNAAQAMSEHTVDRNELRVATGSSPQGVWVEIEDNGPGIDPMVMGRMFEPFVTTKPIGVGTGLGLSICKRIIDDLGGKIAVDTELGRGTKIRITLPPAVAVSGPAPSRPAPAARHATARVLVIDDEAQIGASLRRTLRGHHVVTVTEGAQAVQRLSRGERFDVILCDLMMPGMTGQMVHAAMVRSAPDQAARMVFMTGGAFTPEARGFLASVPNQRLDKPFTSQIVRELVSSVGRLTLVTTGHGAATQH